MPVPSGFSSIGSSSGNLARLSAARKSSASPENPTGGKGKGGGAIEGNASACARDLGGVWKVNPFPWIAAGETVTLADLKGRSGARYRPLKNGIASTVFWYKTLPAVTFPPLPDADAFEIN
jgi:hypothetical protein